MVDKKIIAGIGIGTIILIVCCGLLFWPTDPLYDPSYFDPLTKDKDIQTALKILNVNNCNELKDTYFNDTVDTNIAVQASAYEIGLCTKQNLSKSINLYEQLHQDSDDAFLAALRLALIYSYGPKNLRDYKRAKFMKKQIAIYLFVDDPIKRSTQLNALKNNNFPFISETEQHFSWIEKQLKKPLEEREKIAKDLQKKGFKDTNIIWNEIMTYKPL